VRIVDRAGTTSKLYCDGDYGWGFYAEVAGTMYACNPCGLEVHFFTARCDALAAAESHVQEEHGGDRWLTVSGE
jgi:hypothetical protein